MSHLVLNGVKYVIRRKGGKTTLISETALAMMYMAAIRKGQ